MRKLIILLALLFICCQNNNAPKVCVDYKYHVGDVVFIKVDNNRCVIESRTIIRDSIPAYYIHYKDSDGDYSEDLITEIDLSKIKI
jgi:hypothetical protein